MNLENFTFTQKIEVIEQSDTLEQMKLKALSVTPTKQQLEWQKLEMTSFLHFGMNTFTDKEWGDGTDAIDTFCPTSYDADQWVRVLSESGFKAAIVTAKHHDGFCLWPTKYTDYSVKNAKWMEGKADIVRDVSEACKKYGLKFGIYLSPWDRHDKRYGNSPEYNDYFVNQLTELLTNYGDVYEVWFDGACAEGANGKKQEYDWKRYFSLIRKLQSNAIISIMGPDVRWVGNEAGVGRKYEWSVIPHGKLLAKENEKEAFIFSGVDLCQTDLGGDDALLEAAEKGGGYLFWYPAQVDTSVRPGWFYHTWEDIKVKSLDNLLNIYYSSVGSNAQLLLNIPPNKEGLISEYDKVRLKEFSEYLKKAFEKNLAETASVKQFMECGSHITEIRINEPSEVNCLTLCEDVMKGQRIGELSVLVLQDGKFKKVAEAGTVGYKKIIPFKTVISDTIRIEVTDFRAEPIYSFIGLYRVPDLNVSPTITRDVNGMVTISAVEGAKIFYSIGEKQEKQEYIKPFFFPEGGTVNAVSVQKDGNLFGNEVVEVAQTFGVIKKGWSVSVVSGQCASADNLNNLLNDDKPHIVLENGNPAAIVYDMEKEIKVAGFLYLPVSDIFDFSANLYEYEVSLSSDGVKWSLAARGVFDNIKNNPLQQEILFDFPVSGKYLKLTAVRGFDSNRVAFGKLSVIKSED